MLHPSEKAGYEAAQARLRNRASIAAAYESLKAVYADARRRETEMGRREPFVGALACALTELDAALHHLSDAPDAGDVTRNPYKESAETDFTP